jgi:cyclophilin family peptidyl-prolyl cis-trans isomerase
MASKKSSKKKKPSSKPKKNTSTPKILTKNVSKNKGVLETSKANIQTNKVDITKDLRYLGILYGLVIIVLFWSFNLYYIPNRILPNRNTERQAREAEDRKQKLADEKRENQILQEKETKELDIANKSEWNLEMTFKDYGTIRLNLKNRFAPITVENFVRLASRGNYDQTYIHRIVEEDTFSVIQGGDFENGDGTGGRTAFYLNEEEPGIVPDEIWKVEPSFKQDENGNSILSNKPEFVVPELYADFNTEAGTVKYIKGLILMAKTEAKDSASSQFFITTKDTILPAQYTVFGTINPEDFAVLDKITEAVDPITQVQSQEQAPIQGGKPNSDILIESVRIVSSK